MDKTLTELNQKFDEILQIDQADLDFGIYRILNFYRERIRYYLEHELTKDIEKSFEKYRGKQTEVLQKEMNELRNMLVNAGVGDVENVPKIIEFKELIALTQEVSNTKETILSDLLDFFRHYYSDGDFINQPRYADREYYIPYSGEEVKLHWANAGQYYVKTAERFRDYRFKLANGKFVNFKLTSANTEEGNKKSTDKERRFMFVGMSDADTETQRRGDAETRGQKPKTDELFINFAYQADEAKHSQKELNAETVNKIINETEGFIEWRKFLSDKLPTPTNPQRTVLEKYLNDYTAKNTFDYFIHPKLDDFLSTELDFYIKRRVLRLENIENETPERVALQMAKVKALRIVGGKIIKLLAQIENFQKKLFLKKKFVVETNYCISLEKINQSFYAEIARNEAQIAEWKDLFKIDEIEADLFNNALADNEQSGNTHEVSVLFLEHNPHLLIDTKFFSEDFKLRLLSTIENLDAETDGLLIKSDNFQALNLLQEKYAEQIKCIHIDPPYNTETSGFLYKNGYKHSSWLSMMENRITLSFNLMTDDSSQICHIDENEYERLRMLYESNSETEINTVIWDKRNPMNAGKGVANQHEYIIWQTRKDEPLYLRNDGINLILESAKKIIEENNSDIPKSQKEFAKWIDSNDELSGGEKAYRFLNEQGNIYQSVSLRAPEPRLDAKFHQPLIHPITKKPCPVPPNGFSRTPETLSKMLENGQILFGENENIQPRQKVFLTDSTKRQISSVIQDAKKGKTDLLPLGLDFPYCHPTSLYEKLIGTVSKEKSDVILDFFAGSGTTGHAVINLNREDGGKRKFILVEANDYFETVLKPRILKVLYAAEWKDGKPKQHGAGTSAIIKYLTLESYEDAMNNLKPRKDAAEIEEMLLDFDDTDFREDFLLNYILDFELSGSLLNLQMFEKPFEYELEIASNGVGETARKRLDLVETFNYLIGLNVEKIERSADLLTLRGETRTGTKILVIWRDLTDETAETKLRQLTGTVDLSAFEQVYTNGENLLGTYRKENETWEVKSIEQEFFARMFAE